MKKFLSILLCLVMVIGLASCGEAKQEAAAPVDEDKMLICCVAGEVGIPYFATMQWGALQAGKDLGVDVYWTGPADWDVSAQMNFIDGCLAMNPDGLMICPADPESYVAYVEKWMSEGIGVVCTDSALSEHADIVALGSNSYNGGQEAAQYMFDTNGAGGTYLPLGSSIGSYSTALRLGGFIDKMKELDPTATILDSVYCEYEATRAAELVAATIMGNPDLSGVFCASSAAATGASSAVIEAGKSGQVKLAAFDADPQQIQDLKDGLYDVVIAQDPYRMGYEAVEILVKYAKGEITTADYPDAEIDFPTMAIHAGNVDSPEAETFKYISDVSLKGF